MRRFRLLILGIFGATVALSVDSLRVITSIVLCGTLSFYSFSTAQYSFSIAHFQAAQAAIPPVLEGQEIAIPPIIREAPIDLQGALADDFIVSRQTPYSSGRNEVLIVSPSTGTEQRFEISLPTGDRFQLYEVGFSKVNISNPSEILESAPEQVQSMLENFSISFDSSNLASKVTLANGSRAEFSATEAVVYGANGEEVETLSLSSSSLPYSNNAFLEKSLNLDKPSASMIAKAAGCESGIRDQLYISGQDTGRKSNALRKSRSAQGKAASWVAAFGKRALEDSLIAETRNQTLQEIACIPPIECDQQQDYQGASEIRTDLFEIPGGAGQQINIKYEFFEIPDRMEIYYQGELVDSIPKGIDQISGNGQRSIDLPGGADFVGVKLIGNEDEGTRWNYTIFCSADCDQINIDEEIAKKEARTEAASAEWSYIKDVMENYYEENIDNPAAAAFSAQMYNLAVGSFSSRSEISGWAGDFTRNTLLIAAKDIASNRAFWDSPPPVPKTIASWRNSQFGWIFARACNTIESVDVGIDPYNNSDRAYDCGFGRAGEHHINRHLRPAFTQEIRSRLLEVLENDCIKREDLAQELVSTMRGIRAEHSALLDSVLVPGVSTLPITSVVGWPASWNVPRIAKDLREDILGEILEDYVNQGLITEDIAEKVDK